MSDGISRMYDDYDDYCHRCEKLGVKPISGLYGGNTNHERWTEDKVRGKTNLTFEEYDKAKKLLVLHSDYQRQLAKLEEIEFQIKILESK